MRLLAAPLTLLMLGGNVVRADETNINPDFSCYSQTDSFSSHLQAHAAELNLAHGYLLRISAFPEEDHYALQYSVTQSGIEQDARDVYNWAIQNRHHKQLSPDALASLRAAIRQLPEGHALPSRLDRLVVVSFRDEDRWLVRAYDSKDLPLAMCRIYDLIGERFESKGR